MLKLLLPFALMAAIAGCSPKTTPVKLPPGAKSEVFTIASAQGTNTTKAVDPTTGGTLYLELPPFLTTADVSTVARSEKEVQRVNGTPSEPISLVLHVELTPAGSAKMSAATATLKGKKIAFVINGQVLATPTVHSQIREAFEISGGDSRLTSTVEAITTL